MRRPAVAIYRHELLAASETFIPAQAAGLTGFDPLYIGLRTVPGLMTPEDATIVAGSRAAAIALELGLPVRSFVERIRARGPALIHAHFEGGGIVAMAVARALGVPLVVTCHGFDVTMDDAARLPNPLTRAFYRRRRRQLRQSGALFIAVSEHIRRAMLARGYPDSRIRVHHIGVDTARITPGPSRRDPVVLFVGRLVEKKGAEYVIRAMPDVAARVPAARAEIIGDGPLRGSLESLAAGLGAPVSFRGSLPWNEAIESMRNARVLSVPTVRAHNGDMDGCAMVLAEAQAAGTPVVAFDTGGTPEAVLGGKTGLLSPERDHAGLARGIIELFEDDDRWRRFSEAGRAHVQSKFDVRKQSRALESIYGEALDEYRRTRPA